MPTIKELARAAGVSPSTVSIVLSGKSTERKITQETQDRVWQVAKELGYRPNVSARRLRMGPDESLVLAVFWASDFRAPLMVRFLRGLQAAVLESGRPCEIIIHTYHNNDLEKSMKALGMCDAAIICNASPTDMAFLDGNTFAIPIVLYNRESESYCTVNVDNFLMGRLAAEVFARHGHKSAVMLTSDSVFAEMDARVHGFADTAEAAGMQLLRVHEDSSMAGGYQGGLAISSLRPLPGCLFAMSDAMALGALRAFGKKGVRVPEDIEIISIGNSDKETEEYASVSLSVVHLPMERMAESCFTLVLDLLDDRVRPPYSVKLPVAYHPRESCAE